MMNSRHGLARLSGLSNELQSIAYNKALVWGLQ